MSAPAEIGATSAGRIRPADVPWETFHDPHGRPTTPVRVLKANDPYLIEADFPPNFYAGLHWHPFDTLYLFAAGEMRIGAEGRFGPGDVRWVRAGHAYGPEEAGPQGVRFFLVSLGGPIGLNWADLYTVPASLNRRLEGFATRFGRASLGAGPAAVRPGPFGGPGTSVHVLAEDGPHIEHVTLSPQTHVAAHVFSHDVLLLVREGLLTGADGEDYAREDIRWLKAGTPAAGLQAGPRGAAFFLVGLDGPPAARLV